MFNILQRTHTHAHTHTHTHTHHTHTHTHTRTRETNLFCEILAEPANNFMEPLWRWSLKKHSTVKYLIPLLLNLKKVLKKKGSEKKIFKEKKKETKFAVEVEAFP